MNGFLKFILIFISGLIMWIMWDTQNIAANVKVIRATITQQAKECHNLDTMEVK